MSGQWIPCSERIPDDNVDVLLVWQGAVRVGLMSERGFFHSGGSVARRYEVTHWMPFPNPPRTVKGRK